MRCVSINAWILFQRLTACVCVCVCLCVCLLHGIRWHINKQVRNYILRMSRTRSNVPTSMLALNFTEISTCCVMIIHVFIKGLCHDIYLPTTKWSWILRIWVIAKETWYCIQSNAENSPKYAECEFWSHSVHHLNMRVHYFCHKKSEGQFVKCWYNYDLNGIQSKSMKTQKCMCSGLHVFITVELSTLWISLGLLGIH